MTDANALRRALEQLEAANEAVAADLTAPQVLTAIQMLANAGFTVVTGDLLLKITAEIRKHPDDYDGPCDCRTCLSYADE